MSSQRDGDNVHEYKSPEDLPLVFGCRELARILGVSMSTARTIMHREDFPSHAITPRKHRIFKSEFLAWMERRVQ